ncbi:hypothetical protein V2J09_005006 [Rumex salicifolius]
MTTTIIILPLLFVLLPQLSLSALSPAKPVKATVVCNSTLYPGYCTEVLRQNDDEANVYEYGLFSLKRSIRQAERFLSLVDRQLSRGESELTRSEILALQDCRILVELNVDYLTDSFHTLSVADNKTLSDAKAEEVQTLMSAALTNQQTCLDSLKNNPNVTRDWSLKSELSPPLSNDTKLYSVSLSLVSKGWIPKRKHTRGGGRTESESAFRHGRLPFKKRPRARQIFEAGSRRKLLSDDSQMAVTVSNIVTVNQNGSGDYTTIMEAVAAAPNNTNGSNGYFLIYVTAGLYEEYVTIDKPKKYVLMIGDGINQTVITGNRSVADGWTTFSCATFTVMGTGFVGVDLTIRNTAGAVNHQAVALRSSADLTTFYSMSFEGYQDTLYTHSLRQFYRDCDVYGTVDFVFGNAAAVLQNCNLYPRLPLKGQFNAVTAQGRTDPNQNTGYSLLNCTILPTADLAPNVTTVQTYLGRPWKEYSRTVYMLSYLDGFINPAGWSVWSGTFALDTLYYGEFNNTGPGSDTTNRVTWAGYHIMNETDAANFTVSSFLVGDYWLNNTGVPYYGGLYEIV